jgi:hypothetical protein
VVPEAVPEAVVPAAFGSEAVVLAVVEALGSEVVVLLVEAVVEVVAAD